MGAGSGVAQAAGIFGGGSTAVFDDPSKAGILEFKDGSGRIEGLLLSPSKKLLEADPALRAKFEAWSAEQCYERFCNIYVALTRAKHATYVLLPKAPANPSSGRRHDLWIRSAVSGGGTVEWNGRTQLVLHEAGNAAWFAGASSPEQAAVEEEESSLGPAVARRERVTPSAAKKRGLAPSAAGMAFGNEVHAAFERIGWIDVETVELPGGTAGQMVRELLEVPEIRGVFLRGGRAVELRREQPVDAILDGRWLSGTIDRLHLFLNADGKVSSAEIVDFKTDAVSSGEELVSRYSDQMRAYREVIERAFGVTVKCRLLSTRLKGCFDC
jgi:ATP-dependent exoDNAse (exonuclease V) beta subunit